jgi:hypothetical protein
MTELAAACELVKQEGMSFKLKARLQSEALLETSWRLIHAPHSEVPAMVKSRLMEATWRMAGFDSKDVNTPGGSAGLAIQINFNGGQPQIGEAEQGDAIGVTSSWRGAGARHEDPVHPAEDDRELHPRLHAG